ncbi:MAG TPA: hypothetical protein VJT11_02330 [Nitrospiraceae bacterium]|nr:hypothetical protein [Nitrospiraceae bacterium]
MMVYIAAEKPLDTVAWDESEPAFYVSELHESELPVRSQFGVQNVYYTGSHEGCGCGFQYGEHPQFEDEERALKRKSLDSFADYLTEQLKRVNSIELYACWDGDQTAPPEHRRALSPDSLHSEHFYFLEKELSIVRSGTT